MKREAAGAEVTAEQLHEIGLELLRWADRLERGEVRVTGSASFKAKRLQTDLAFEELGGRAAN